MFNCPNCGGSLVFDIQTQTLKCQHCGSSMNVEEYHTNNQADAQTDEFGVHTYTCRNCGAELSAPDAAFTGFCSYCGYENVMEEKLDSMTRPKYIIPFQVTKEKCRRNFKLHTHLPYVPSEFRNPEFLETFRGIYIPYWMYDISFADPLVLKAYKSYRDGDYRVYDSYTVPVKLEGATYGVPYDASRAFDDSIAAELTPFRKEDLKEFREEYLAGFYADKADVGPGRYEKDAVDYAADVMIRSINLQLDDGIWVENSSENPVSRQMQTGVRQADSALFPVWFLTWRNRDRVAYAIMNGQTGKLSFDVPVDLKKIGIAIALSTALIYAGLDRILALSARTAAACASCFTVFVMAFLKQECEQVFIREYHLDDRGYGTPDKKKVYLLERAFSYGFCAVGMMMLLWTLIIQALPVGVTAASGLLCLILYLRMRKQARQCPGSFRFLSSGIVLILADIAGAVLLYLDLVSDLIYYSVSSAILLGILYACWSLLKNYNLSATRPIPSFTDRKGGDGHA